jgi:hypothetical protein
LTDNIKIGSAAVDTALMDGEVAVASDSADAAASEASKTDEAQTISVSPDQEDIELH